MRDVGDEFVLERAERSRHGSGLHVGVEGDAAVVTEHDEAFEADAVVSNADPVATCVDLIGAEHVPAAFFRK